MTQISKDFQGKKEEETKGKAEKARMSRCLCKGQTAHETKYTLNLWGAWRYAIIFVKHDVFCPRAHNSVSDTAQHLLGTKATSLVMQHTHNCMTYLFYLGSYFNNKNATEAYEKVLLLIRKYRLYR